jgi:hypothetical protein
LVGVIADDETKEFTVSVGNHIVMATIDWCGSPDVEVVVKENEIKNLQVSSFRIPINFFPIAITIFILSFVLTTFFKLTWAVYLLIPLPIIPLYYLSFGRKKYLSLIEIKN